MESGKSFAKTTAKV